MFVVYVLIALIVGGLMPIQAGINNRLTTFVNHPLHSAFISFCVGTCCLFFLSLGSRVSYPPIKEMIKIHPSLFLGGILGASFVFCSMVFVGKIGVTPTIAAFITGQLIISLVIDQYGFFGIPISPMNPMKIGGVFCLLFGLFLIIKSKI